MVDEHKKGPAGADFVENINEDFDTFEAWVMDNWRLIVISCVGIVVLVAVVGIGMSVSNILEKKSLRQFSAAESYEQLAAAIEKHPSSNAVPEARMRLAMLQIGKKDYTAAIANFKQVAESSKAADYLRFRASLNVAYALELQGKLDEAATAFGAVGQDALVPEDMRFEANYGAGRILAGKSDFAKAKSFLSKATSVRPRNMSEFFWSSQAKSLLERVQASLPATQPAPAAIAPKTKG